MKFLQTTLGLMLTLTLTLTGCADLTSIWRTEKIDGVHVASLDAKQRLFIANANKFCAEPSPDALSAFASSFGLGVSIPQQAAVSMAQSLNEGAASIGLRTQSIQLLRDMMYRICEAARNEDLNPVMVAQLHERYQDSMVGILAIEQLTGAVQARQVRLGGTANAAAAAGTLLGVTERLEEAEAYEAKKKKEQEEAQSKVDKLAGEENQAGSVKEAQSEHNKAVEEQTRLQQCLDLPDGHTDRPDDCGARAELAGKKTTADTKAGNTKKELEKRMTELKEAEENLERAKNHYETAKRNLDLIGQMQGQAASNASAATSATGEFETGVTFTPISSAVAGQVKDAVLEIVKTVVNKPHEVDTCLVFLTYMTSINAQRDQLTQMSTRTQKQSQRLTKLNEEVQGMETVSGWCKALIKEVGKPKLVMEKKTMGPGKESERSVSIDLNISTPATQGTPTVSAP